MFLSFLPLLLILTVCSASILYGDRLCETKYVLEGIWINERKTDTMMILDIRNDTADVFNNRFTGVYFSNVDKDNGLYNLYGTFNYQDCLTTIGMNVIFSNKKSDLKANSVWVGRLQCKDDKIILETSWLVERFSDGPHGESTLSGTDTFSKKYGKSCTVVADTGASATPAPPPIDFGIAFADAPLIEFDLENDFVINEVDADADV